MKKFSSIQRVNIEIIKILDEVESITNFYKEKDVLNETFYEFLERKKLKEIYYCVNEERLEQETSDGRIAIYRKRDDAWIVYDNDGKQRIVGRGKNWKPTQQKSTDTNSTITNIRNIAKPVLYTAKGALKRTPHGRVDSTIGQVLVKGATNTSRYLRNKRDKDEKTFEKRKKERDKYSRQNVTLNFDNDVENDINQILKKLKDNKENLITNKDEIRNKIINGEFDKENGIINLKLGNKDIEEITKKLRNVKDYKKYSEEIEKGLKNKTLLKRGKIGNIRVIYTVDGYVLKVSKRNGDLYKNDNIVEWIKKYIDKKEGR